MPALNTSSTSLDNDSFELLNAGLGAGDSLGALLIHTARASIAIDENGTCRDVFTLDGSELTDLERCIGAQYVASVDASGVSGQPTVGGHALLMGSAKGDRPDVIKTAAITAVIYSADVIEA